MQIAPEILAKLDKAIIELLTHARLNTVQVRDLLAREQSFGKYDGCTPTAILERANQLCKSFNREQRQWERKVVAEVRSGLRKDLPTIKEFLNRKGL